MEPNDAGAAGSDIPARQGGHHHLGRAKGRHDASDDVIDEPAEAASEGDLWHQGSHGLVHAEYEYGSSAPSRNKTQLH